MHNFILSYISALVSFVAIDSVWLTKVSPNIYRSRIGHLLAEKANLGAAAIFYVIFLFGLVYFVIIPTQTLGLGQVAIKAALFGIVTYGTFDLTNQAVLKNWPTSITVIDMLWGAVLSTSVAVLSHLAVNHFK